MSGFDTTPTPGFLRAMQNQKWTVAGALAELVDNGFGPGRGNARRVTITHDTAKRRISVLDDGYGMEAIGRLFQLGNTIGRTPGDIGLYGSGGTMAVLWLARRVSVWTLKDGLVSRDSIDWPKQIAKSEFPFVSDRWVKATLGNTPEDLLNVRHGTLILLELANERKFQSSNVQRDLAATYAPATRMGKELVWQTIGKNGGERILADPMPIPPDPEKSIAIDLTLMLPDHAPLGVTGRIGLIEGLPHSRSVVSIGYGPRVIERTRACYISPDGTEKYAGSGVAGWLDLGEGWQPFLVTTKDAINDQPVWEALMARIFEYIRPLLQQVDTEELYLELDEIAIQLEEALNGRAKVEVLREGITPVSQEREQVEGNEREPKEEPESQEEPTPADDDPSDDPGDEATQQGPAVATVGIFRQTDAEMEGLLCKTEIWGDKSIIASINVEHHVVQEALVSKPTNRSMLHVMVTREIAHSVAANEAVMQRMFAPSMLKQIDEREETDRPAFIARLLMDRVRRVSKEEATL